MKPLSCTFFLTVYSVFAHGKCDGQSSCIIPIQQTNLGEHHVILEELVENSNFTTISELPAVLNISSNASSFSSEFEDVGTSVLSNAEKGRACLKNLTKCRENDNSHETIIPHLSRHLFSALPPFDLSVVRGVTNQCRKDSQLFINELKKFKLWALKMYDSTAKPPSGFLNGNVNQLGDFDLCLAANLKERGIYGQYCLASMQVEAPKSPYLSAIHKLIHSHNAFKSKLQDPGHRVPRYSSINWAICVPSSCTANDVKKGLAKTIERIFKETEFEISLAVEESMCQTSPRDGLPRSTIIVGSLFAAIIVLTLLATVYDFYTINDRSALLLSFSLLKNVKSLISIERPSNDIEVIHGIRFINAAILLLAHKSLAIFFVPYMNRTAMTEMLGKPWTTLGRAASLYTDPFIMISGILTAYSLIGKLQRTNKINILEEYISRIFRILPPLGALILFCTFILPFLSSGPFWNLVVTEHANICKQYWWRNLLFIHNFMGFQNLCLSHTHHVGIDTQLFFLSPFMILLLWKLPKKGMLFLIAVAAWSTLLRYYMTYTKGLSNYIHFGTSIEQLFKTADHMYILPTHRITVYIIGILVGYALKTQNKLELSKSQIRIGNILALFCFLVALIYPAFMGNIDYIYNPADAAWYAAFAPIFWCLSFAWVIFTSHLLQYKTLISEMLAFRLFLITTRIAYTVYLTQFPVFFFNIGTIRTPEYYGFLRMMVSISEYILVIFFAIVLTLLIEMPFQNIRNVLFSSKKQTHKPTENGTKVDKTN